MTAYGQLLLTLVLLLFGLQIESEPGRISLTETISAYSRRTHTFLLCKWLTVMLVSLLLTALFAGFVYFGTLMQTNAPWTKQVLLHIVLLYFLPLCISGSAGILFARIFPSRNAYFFAFLFWFCTSSLMADYAETFAALGLSGGTMAQAMLNLGVANMRQISGAVMALGALYGSDDPAHKTAVYAMVQELAAKFKAETGSLKDLLDGSDEELEEWKD